MNSPAADWFSPAPSEITSSRISLDFNLRAADLFFRELVVPELGRIWFARQLSWPLAALALHEELANWGRAAPKPTVICHGVEALACKLEFEYRARPEGSSGRILGIRAFGRDSGVKAWSFLSLRQAANYVRNTHRQAATRAIRVNGGLGFARGSRFDFFELEPVGRELATAFLGQPVGQGGMSLRKWLCRWLEGEQAVPNHPQTLLAALSPEHVLDEERGLVRSRLLQTLTPASEKRQRLAQTVGRAADMRSIEDIVQRLRNNGHDDQANEIIAARAFGSMLDRARDAVACLTCAVAPERDRLGITTLATHPGLQRSFEGLRSAAESYLVKANTAKVDERTSRIFAGAIIAADASEAIRLLVARTDRLLGLVGDRVGRGSLFRVVDLDPAAIADDPEDGAAAKEPDRAGRTFRIANLHSLLRDVNPRGGR